MVSPEMNPTICSVFEAEIVLLFHATTFRRGFQVTVHVGNVRQTAVVEKIHAKVRGAQPCPCFPREKSEFCFQKGGKPVPIFVESSLIPQRGQSPTWGVGQTPARPPRVESQGW